MKYTFKESSITALMCLAFMITTVVVCKKGYDKTLEQEPQQVASGQMGIIHLPMVANFTMVTVKDTVAKNVKTYLQFDDSIFMFNDKSDLLSKYSAKTHKVEELISKNKQSNLKNHQILFLYFNPKYPLKVENLNQIYYWSSYQRKQISDSLLSFSSGFSGQTGIVYRMGLPGWLGVISSIITIYEWIETFEPGICDDLRAGLTIGVKIGRYTQEQKNEILRKAGCNLR